MIKLTSFISTLAFIFLVPQISGAAKAKLPSKAKVEKTNETEKELKSYLSGLQKKVVDTE